MTLLHVVPRGILLLLAVGIVAPCWGQKLDPPNTPLVNATPEQIRSEKILAEQAKATQAGAAENQASATENKTEQDNSGSTIYDVGVEPAAVEKAKRERLSDRQRLYYTYPPAYRYPRGIPYYYQSGSPSYFYGGGWPRGYQLGSTWINPNVGNHF